MQNSSFWIRTSSLKYTMGETVGGAMPKSTSHKTVVKTVEKSAKIKGKSHRWERETAFSLRHDGLGKRARDRRRRVHLQSETEQTEIYQSPACIYKAETDLSSAGTCIQGKQHPHTYTRRARPKPADLLPLRVPAIIREIYQSPACIYKADSTYVSNGAVLACRDCESGLWAFQ